MARLWFDGSRMPPSSKSHFTKRFSSQPVFPFLISVFLSFSHLLDFTIMLQAQHHLLKTPANKQHQNQGRNKCLKAKYTRDKRTSRTKTLLSILACLQRIFLRFIYLSLFVFFKCCRLHSSHISQFIKDQEKYIFTWNLHFCGNI